MLTAAGSPARAYIEAQQRRRVYTAVWEEALAPLDALAAPTLAAPAAPIGAADVAVGRARESVRLAMIRFTRASNLTGLPAVSVPCGFSRDGLPIGLQLIGRRLDEARLLRVAHAYEAVTPWHERFPV
jgi:aspartyl-tRNA(Asn)/glutamyl-tRNA(Gln) amidotransferase subunit A